MKKLTALVFAAALVLGGCGGSDDADQKPTPSASADQKLDDLRKQAEEQKEQAEQAEKSVVKIVIANGKVTPQGGRVDVKVGQPVTLVVSSDQDDEIHVHSDPEHGLDVEAGDKNKELTFTLDTPGQVAVESHHLDVTIVQLVATP